VVPLKGVATLLIQDRRAALARRVQRAVANGGIVAAFAWYWLPAHPAVPLDFDLMISQAVKAKGAARTFREVAMLGYAVAGGRDQPDVIAALDAGLRQLAGRDFSIAGTCAPVCDDPIALLGLALGSKSSADASVRSWLVEACRLSGTRHNLSGCEKALIGSAATLAAGSPVGTSAYPPLRLAACSRGLSASGAAEETVAIGFLKTLIADDEDTDEEAILSLCALDWLLRSAPAIDLNVPSIQAVCDVLGRTSASLHRWVFEEHPKTKSATARQWHIDNEYHVQSLLWAILAPVFPELREEEWLTPVGQKKPRADLCLPGLQLIIEVKFWRVGTKVQDLIEEVAADTSLYLVHGSPYSSIVVFVWDDTASSDQHHVLAQGLRTLKGIVGVVIQARPSRFGTPASAAKKQNAAKPQPTEQS
jgi:hypothetical protein